MESVSSHHLKKWQVGNEAVVEVDFRREPGVVVDGSQQSAVVLGRDDVETQQLARLINAAAEPSAEQVDSHDAEDQPEDEADEQDVENCWDCLDQRVHYHLHASHVQQNAGNALRPEKKVPLYASQSCAKCRPIFTVILPACLSVNLS